MTSVRSHPLVAYFAIAYGVSWLLWLPLVATVQGWWDVDVPSWWHYSGAAGPVTAAIVVSAATQGWAGVKALLDHFRPSRVRPAWLAFVVFSPLLLLVAGLIATRLSDGVWPAYADLSRTDNLPELGLPLTLAIHILSFGLGEETGWRGFALPRLQASLPAIQSAHVLAVGWGLWHLPTFFENESMLGMGPLDIVGWSAGLWMGSIFLTWLFNSSGGSLLVIVLWHGLFNQFAASEAPSVVPAVLTMGVIVTAIAAIQLAGPHELTGLSSSGGRRQQYVSP